MLTWLLVVEAIGAFLVAALMLAGSDFLGSTVVPPWVAIVPAVFGVLFGFVARQVHRRSRWRLLSVIWAQGWILTGAIVGLVFSAHPSLAVAIVMAVAGIALAVVAQKEEETSGF